ncbi:MAG TPA: ABC transporter permease subunit [Candidatus Dormibacteraeota bacterium]|jgi:ABC-2 type transport system permease protein
MLRKSLWDLGWTAFWYAAGGAVYIFAIALFYPTVREQAETFTKLVAVYPKALLAIFGFTDITTYTGFMGTETLNLIWPVVIIVFATLGGSAVVAKEVEDGTAEVLLSVPARRWRLLLAKEIALAIGLVGTVLAAALALVLGAVLVSASVKPEGLLAMAVVMAAFLFTVAAYTSLFSSLTSSRGAAAGMSLGVTVASYLMWVVATLGDSWKWLKNVSIFTAYTPQKALETGSVDLLSIAILIAMTAVCVVLALVAFERRDAVA